MDFHRFVLEKRVGIVRVFEMIACSTEHVVLLLDGPVRHCPTCAAAERHTATSAFPHAHPALVGHSPDAHYPIGGSRSVSPLMGPDARGVDGVGHQKGPLGRAAAPQSPRHSTANGTKLSSVGVSNSNSSLLQWTEPSLRRFAMRAEALGRLSPRLALHLLLMLDEVWGLRRERLLRAFYKAKAAEDAAHRRQQLRNGDSPHDDHAQAFDASSRSQDSDDEERRRRGSHADAGDSPSGSASGACASADALHELQRLEVDAIVHLVETLFRPTDEHTTNPSVNGGAGVGLAGRRASSTGGGHDGAARRRHSQRAHDDEQVAIAAALASLSGGVDHESAAERRQRTIAEYHHRRDELIVTQKMFVLLFEGRETVEQASDVLRDVLQALRDVQEGAAYLSAVLEPGGRRAVVHEWLATAHDLFAATVQEHLYAFRLQRAVRLERHVRDRVADVDKVADETLQDRAAATRLRSEAAENERRAAVAQSSAAAFHAAANRCEHAIEIQRQRVTVEVPAAFRHTLQQCRDEALDQLRVSVRDPLEKAQAAAMHRQLDSLDAKLVAIGGHLAAAAAASAGDTSVQCPQRAPVWVLTHRLRQLDDYVANIAAPAGGAANMVSLRSNTPTTLLAEDPREEKALLERHFSIECANLHPNASGDTIGWALTVYRFHAGLATVLDKREESPNRRHRTREHRPTTEPSQFTVPTGIIERYAKTVDGVFAALAADYEAVLGLGHYPRTFVLHPAEQLLPAAAWLWACADAAHRRPTAATGVLFTSLPMIAASAQTLWQSYVGGHVSDGGGHFAAEQRFAAFCALPAVIAGVPLHSLAGWFKDALTAAIAATSSLTFSEGSAMIASACFSGDVSYRAFRLALHVVRPHWTHALVEVVGGRGPLPLLADPIHSMVPAMTAPLDVSPPASPSWREVYPFSVLWEVAQRCVGRSRAAADPMRIEPYLGLMDALLSDRSTARTTLIRRWNAFVASEGRHSVAQSPTTQCAVGHTNRVTERLPAAWEALLEASAQQSRTTPAPASWIQPTAVQDPARQATIAVAAAFLVEAVTGTPPPLEQASACLWAVGRFECAEHLLCMLLRFHAAAAGATTTRPDALKQSQAAASTSGAIEHDEAHALLSDFTDTVLKPKETPHVLPRQQCLESLAAGLPGAVPVSLWSALAAALALSEEEGFPAHVLVCQLTSV